MKKITKKDCRKNAIQLFFELGYDELGAQITSAFEDAVESLFKDTSVTLEEMEEKVSGKLFPSLRKKYDSFESSGSFKYQYAACGERTDAPKANKLLLD